MLYDYFISKSIVKALVNFSVEYNIELYYF
jgi:hypothetical protein